MLATEIFKKLLITEKSYKLMEKQQIVFVVDVRADKAKIKSAFETIFGYEVLKVNIARRKPKKKRVGRHVGKTNRLKKAIITLKPGQKFDLLNKDGMDGAAPSAGDVPAAKSKGFFSRFRSRIEDLTKLDLKSNKEKDKK